MYRLTVLFLLFIACSVAEGHHRCHGDHTCKHNNRQNRHSDRHYEKVFEKVARNLIAAEREFQNGCTENTNNPIREVFGWEFYVLKYTLPEFTEGEFNIRIKHRVIYLSATKPNGLSFRDIRILPQVVKTQDSHWFIDDGVMNVMFTYKNPFDVETVKVCGDHITESVLSVPRSPIVSTDLRSGDLVAAFQHHDNVTVPTEKQ